jgi:uncharacterized protein YjbI with pentapeptide repeats
MSKRRIQVAVSEEKRVKERVSKREKTIAVLGWIYHYSGGKFVIRKFKPADKSQLPTGWIWLLGIYVAFFGVASQRYENRIDKIENRANAIFAQLASSSESVRKSALSSIARTQRMPCPSKPNILRPYSVFLSLFKDSKYDEIISLLRETVENWKDALDSADLRGANLAGAALYKANLRGTDLSWANLRGANLADANLSGADLWSANLRESYPMGAILIKARLEMADLRKAYLNDANLEGAKLWGADLRGTYNLTIEQLSTVESLYEAKLDPDLMEQVKKKYPHLLEKPEVEN